MKDKVIVIAGLGLLGGSLGLALKGKCSRIGWARRQETMKQALDLAAVDRIEPDLCTALSAGDIVVLALPVPVILELLPLCAKHCKRGAIVTDIGSIKGRILSEAESVFTTSGGPYFVGSHPMAGTEKSGISAAFPTLYDNADVFITPARGVPSEVVSVIRSFWESIRCSTAVIGAEHHDILVANTSHVLHVVASALCTSILDSGDATEKEFRFRGCATGFRDTCRIASSSPVMWREIIESNREAVLLALGDFEKRLIYLRGLISAGHFEEFEREFARGKVLRDEWLAYKTQKK